MTRVYRISKPEHVDVALQGHGSALYPGRWNSQGTRLAYTASHVSLCMLEMLVHVDKEDVPTNRQLLSFDVPDDAITDIEEGDLPPEWNQLPYSEAVRQVGDRWIAAGTSLALRVPSAVARYEYNVLINPAHPRFSEIQRLKVEPLALDPRLFE